MHKQTKQKRKSPNKDMVLLLAKRLRRFCRTGDENDRLKAIIAADKAFKNRNEIIQRFSLTVRSHLVSARPNPWTTAKAQCMLLGSRLLEQGGITEADFKWFQRIVITQDFSE